LVQLTFAPQEKRGNRGNPALTQGRSAVNKSEVILEVGAEGGAITLYGVRAPDGWRFSTSMLDQTPSLLPDAFHEQGSRKDYEGVNPWEAALRLIDRYPWHRLHPLTVHPEFGERVLDCRTKPVRQRSKTGEGLAA